MSKMWIEREDGKEMAVPQRSSDTIYRQTAIDAFMTATADGDKAEWCKWVIEQLPSAQPEPHKDDPRADVYYLAEKIGIHRLYALVVELRGEPEPCEDAVSREAVLDMLHQECSSIVENFMKEKINAMPSVTPKEHPEIIHCRDCKRWDDSPSSTIAPMFHKCRDFNHHTEATDFCSHAERREE